jgi:hypothetical protein
MKKSKEVRKVNHQRSMRLTAALALEHGLRFLPADDLTRKVIEEDIEIVRQGGDCQEQYKQAKKRKIGYTPIGLLLQGSVALLKLAKYRGYPTDGMLQNVCYFPTEAGYLVSQSTRDWK